MLCKHLMCFQFSTTSCCYQTVFVHFSFQNDGINNYGYEFCTRNDKTSSGDDASIDFLFFEIIRANNRLRKWVSKRQFTLFIGLQTRHRTINSGVAVLCFWINQNVIWSYFYPDWNHWAEYYILENFKWRTRDAMHWMALKIVWQQQICKWNYLNQIKGTRSQIANALKIDEYLLFWQWTHT